MGILINTSDFKNQDLYAKYYIPFSSSVCGSEEKLKGYIERYEKKYLIQLLGVELSKLFIADLVDQVPIDPIYLDIYNSIEEDLTTGDSAYSSFCGCDRKIICTNGMKSMILGFVFFEYMRDQPFSKDLTVLIVLKLKIQGNHYQLNGDFLNITTNLFLIINKHNTIFY